MYSAGPKYSLNCDKTSWGGSVYTVGSRRADCQCFKVELLSAGWTPSWVVGYIQPQQGFSLGALTPTVLNMAPQVKVCLGAILFTKRQISRSVIIFNKLAGQFDGYSVQDGWHPSGTAGCCWASAWPGLCLDPRLLILYCISAVLTTVLRIGFFNSVYYDNEYQVLSAKLGNHVS